ncbi:glycosyltransferase family 2 protein [Candidatus Halobeggiatoa sp. HSG11]|nr:glycosyltransferase family 2 protein [Candidatus Halobeggiatoa sp. HSG11]
MNLFKYFQSKSAKSTITDKQPAATLLGNQRQAITLTTSEGNIPISLAEADIKFNLIPNDNIITGIRLRFGTYCRTNNCHITIEINEYNHSINANFLIDNEYIDIPFPTVQTCVSGQPLEITITSKDANKNNSVAVWCNRMLPQFINTISPQPIILPEVAKPTVSIVIPVFNKAIYTYNCLLTVKMFDPEISKEIIIVNNASSDETIDLLKQLQGAVQVINNKENQGFVEACRQGAAIAKGEFVLFLNNDTQVLPYWLKNMVNTMNANPKIGITGSKLTYPNGQLQEAGGMIFNDASGWNYGRLQEPTNPKYNQSREVDYCSGASLMIRKALWEQIGGFDLRYAPAYYEDTDLCFATRQAGYKVFYCHDSEVIHHEGITAGTDIQTGYKAYQAINRKKFQAKWWNVLSSHPPPPPQSSPDAAAFRFKTDNGFRIPEGKILATHFLAQGWAANFWSYLNLKQVDAELEFIQSVGFNTVILLVPWTGFQTKIEPITYYEEYFTLFEQLLERIQEFDLQVILRIGYSHDNGPDSEPEGFLRQVVIGADTATMQAWCDYLDRLWTTVKPYPNVLGGFLTWEDFFLMDLTHIPLDKRIEFAGRSGYRDYLQENYTIDEIANRYKQPFANYNEVPIPAFKSNAIHLFCEFWDDLLINVILKQSKQHFPALSMEIRTDCDPQEDTHICHKQTFDLTENIDISTIYYTPAWGASNDGDLESAATILQRMQFMFEHIRSYTNNVVFIDQFNFIDNTPGFERNTGITVDEMPKFLAGVADILQHNTVGYGMWTLRDVRANALKNGIFARDYPCWQLENTEIVSDNNSQAALLSTGGKLGQSLTWCVGVPYVKDKPFQLDFRLKTADGTGELKLTIWYENKAIHTVDIVPELNDDWQSIHLENIPFYLNHELQLENQGSPILVTDFYLYQLWQENGIVDIEGKPKPFYNDLIALNHKLSNCKTPVPNSYFQQTDIIPKNFDGVFFDYWMGKNLLGLISKPNFDNVAFIVKVYVPEIWQDNVNQLTLTLDGQKFASQKVQTGYNEFKFQQLTLKNDIAFIQLEAEVTHSPNEYDHHSQDDRNISMMLLEFGFIEA